MEGSPRNEKSNKFTMGLSTGGAGLLQLSECKGRSGGTRVQNVQTAVPVVLVDTCSCSLPRVYGALVQRMDMDNFHLFGFVVLFAWT